MSRRLYTPLIIFIIVVFALGFLLTGSLYAAGGTISVDPQSGNFSTGDLIEAKIQIDGGGERFNASEATVNISDNLKAESLTLGDCDFAFVKTPTVTTLSYAGVILGGYKNSCTLYTVGLRVTGANNGFVFISDGSIKSFNGATELLQNIVNSSYAFQGGETQVAQVVPTEAPIVTVQGDKLYRIVYTVPVNEEEIDGLTAILDPGKNNEISSNVGPLNSVQISYGAVFEDVPEGVHEVVVKDDGKVLSEDIINVTGDNREIRLGSETQKGIFSLSNIALTALVFVIVLSLLILGAVFIKRKNPVKS